MLTAVPFFSFKSAENWKLSFESTTLNFYPTKGLLLPLCTTDGRIARNTFFSPIFNTRINYFYLVNHKTLEHSTNYTLNL